MTSNVNLTVLDLLVKTLLDENAVLSMTERRAIADALESHSCAEAIRWAVSECAKSVRVTGLNSLSTSLVERWEKEHAAAVQEGSNLEHPCSVGLHIL